MVKADSEYQKLLGNNAKKKRIVKQDSSPKHQHGHLHVQATPKAPVPSQPKPSNEPPTFGEQIEVIKDWWQTLRESYVKDFNRYEANPGNHKDLSRLTEVPLDKVYDFIIMKHIVADRQMATKLVAQQVGMANLGTTDMMCYEEFNRLFCKGMFKVALINTIAKLTDDSASSAPQPSVQNRGDISASKNQINSLGQRIGEKLLAKVDELKFYQEDAKANFMQEMPLSLKIERYQRGKLMQGLKPKRDAV